MWARNIALALTLASVGADTSSFDIVEAGRVYQQGSYPYLPGYAGLAVNSRQECEKACRDTPECQFGTYVTKDADTTDGYNYQKQAKAGECWLSAQTHSTPTPCGVPCVGFRKTTTCLRIPLDAKYCTYYNGLKFSNHWWILRSTYLEHEAVLQDGAKVRFESKSTGAVTGYATIKTHAKYGKDQEQCARLDQCGGQRPQVCADKFGANNENAMDLGFMFVDQSESPGFRMEMSVGDYMLVGDCNTKDVPTDACPKDVKTCWNGKALGRISATTCKTLGVADDVCAANACQFGEIIGTDQIRWGCEKREECTCDPSLHPSHFNTCHQDPWSRHIVVTHLPRRFHAKTFEEGAQHRCAMVGGGENPVCQCCTCMQGTHRLSDGFLDLGRESHPVLPDSAHFETKDADSFKDCEAQCGDDCKWGSFIARKDAKGSCVISFSDAVKTADNKLKTVRCPPTTDKCHSFLHSGLEADAVDAGNSKAFIRKSVDADGKHTISNPTGRQAKQDFEQCLWKNNKCEANDRSGHPGLTGVHKTIPGATETWCDSQGAAGHNMVWRKTSKQCDYGCHIIEDEAQCALAEDHFKIEEGAKPCSPGQLWNTAKEACNTCADATYQWPAAHFIDRCFQCPYAKGSTKFKDLTEGQDLCKGDCITRSTTCSDKAKCGTLVSPELEAFCKANPDSCTTDDVAAASCLAECVRQCNPCTPGFENKDSEGACFFKSNGQVTRCTGTTWFNEVSDECEPCPEYATCKYGVVRMQTVRSIKRSGGPYDERVFHLPAQLKLTQCKISVDARQTDYDGNGGWHTETLTIHHKDADIDLHQHCLFTEQCNQDLEPCKIDDDKAWVDIDHGPDDHITIRGTNSPDSNYCPFDPTRDLDGTVDYANGLYGTNNSPSGLQDGRQGPGQCGSTGEGDNCFYIWAQVSIADCK